MRLLLLSLAILGLITQNSYARPVSYPDAWTAMLMNNGDKNTFHLHYSPSAKYSIGYKFEYWRDQEYTINALQLNNLVKRWNMPDAQANIYLKSGAGIAYSDFGDFDNEVDAVAFTGISADWENRRFFISYENRYTEAGDIADFYMQSARVGVAPYIGDYNDLHTWLMIETEHSPEDDDKLTITPMVRFFKDVHLVEAGMSNHGELLFNWVIRY